MAIANERLLEITSKLFCALQDNDVDLKFIDYDYEIFLTKEEQELFGIEDDFKEEDEEDLVYEDDEYNDVITSNKKELIEEKAKKYDRLLILFSNAICFMEEQNMSIEEIEHYLGTTKDELNSLKEETDL